jgi:NTE family protein
VNRLAREIARCRVGLALSSGAAKGLAHVGVIQVLEENGIEVDCIAGSSMGAYIGSIWAYGLNGEKLEKLARELEGRWGLLRLVDPALPPRRGFLHTRRTVARLRRSIGSAHFSELLRPLRILATHLETLERVVFSTGEVAAAVEASIAIPGVCVPVTLEGETYIDGGIADPLPVDVLAEMGIERIIAVNVIPPPERIRQWLDSRKEQSGRPSEHSRFGRFLSERFNYLARGNILDTMMQAISGSQTRVAEASAREADVVIRPLAGDAEWHDFTNPGKYIALGRSAAEAQLSALKALVRTPSYENKTPLARTPAVAA